MAYQIQRKDIALLATQEEHQGTATERRARALWHNHDYLLLLPQALSFAISVPSSRGALLQADHPFVGNNANFTFQSPPAGTRLCNSLRPGC